MKILILQLARLGDIYMSWPVLRAIRRTYPGAEIHFLCRDRFQAATKGLEVINHLHVLNTEDILSPIFQDQTNTDLSINKLGNFLENLNKQDFDWIINLSFSPVSSYLVHYLANSTFSRKNPKISGYTRHSDGYFAIHDEVSSYFYAQVGTERQNRIHIVDLMAALCEVDLNASDWRGSDITQGKFEINDPYICIHVGTSEIQKSIPGFKWARIIRSLQEKMPNLQLVLVGASNEKHISEAILSGCRSDKILDLVGKTVLSDLFELLQKSKLLVGCDSGPIHIASLVGTACLNISVGQVNFWETGPRAKGSFVYRVNSVEEIVSEYLADAILNVLSGHTPTGLIPYTDGNPCYTQRESKEDRFAWDLISAIYFGTNFPMADDIKFYEIILQMNQINQVVLEQIQMAKKVGTKTLVEYLRRADEIIQTLGKMSPLVEIYTRWLMAERAKLAPMSESELLEKSEEIHQKLTLLLRPYILPEEKEGIYG